MKILSFSNFNTLIETTNSIVKIVENNPEGNLYDFFLCMEAETGLTSEDITGTSGIAQIVLPLAMRLMKRRAPTELKEALTNDDFLAWIKEKGPLFKKKYGEEHYKEILYQAGLAIFNKTDVAKKYGMVNPHSRSNGESKFKSMVKVWEQ